MAEIITEYAHFFTATNLEWNNLLRIDKYKEIVRTSMKHLVKEKRVIIYGLRKLGLYKLMLSGICA